MKVKIQLDRTAMENAQHYYAIYKKYKKKIAGAKKALEKMEKKRANTKEKKERQIKVRKIREKKWYEHFHYFFTSDGILVLAGKNASQNEKLFSKYLEKGDLFMHADVVGAPATIIKHGEEVSESALKEAAQFSASYSSAWKNKVSSVDVYAVSSEQVSKYSMGEYVSKGGFVIKGRRKWFKNVELKLAFVNREGKLLVLPANYKGLKNAVVLSPGDEKKSKVAKFIEHFLKIKEPEIEALIPGESRAELYNFQ